MFLHNFKGYNLFYKLFSKMPTYGSKLLFQKAINEVFANLDNFFGRPLNISKFTLFISPKCQFSEKNIVSMHVIFFFIQSSISQTVRHRLPTSINKDCQH